MAQGPPLLKVCFLAIVATVLAGQSRDPAATPDALKTELAEADALRLGGTASGLRHAAEMYKSAARSIQGAGGQSERGHALLGLGLAHDGLSEKPEAIAAYMEALPIFRAAGDRKPVADILIHLGLDYDYLGDRKRAVEYSDEALAAAGDSDGEAKANVLTHAGQIYDRAGRKEKALALFQEALPMQRAAQNRRGEATVLSGMGVLYYSTGRSHEALEDLQAALALYRETKDSRDTAFVLTSIGAVFYSTDDYARALEYFHEADSEWEACGDRSGKSANLHNLASSYERTGETEKAIDSFEQALALHRAAGYRIGEANTLTSLGQLHAALGDEVSAAAFYEEALPIHRATANRQGEAATLQNLADLHASRGDFRTALDLDLRALPLRRAISDRAGAAGVLNRLGAFYSRLGDRAKALENAGEALEIFRAVGSPRGQAFCLLTMAASGGESGQSAEALELFRQAAAAMASAGDARGEAAAHFGIAQIEAREGRLTDAIAESGAALKLAESVRARVLSPELRAFYFASVRDYFNLQVDLLMRLDREMPGSGYAARALETAEHARARSLVQMLAESQIDIREGVDAKLLKRERTLGRRLDAEGDRRLAMLLSHPEQHSGAEAAITRLTADYRAIQAQIRSASPRYAALAQPPPVTAADIQQKALDSDTDLVEYWLGPERSYLWVASKGSIAGWTLPPVSQIEEAARGFHRLVSAGDPAAAEAGLKLSAMVLGPAAASLKGRRLAVVADGALQYVPFAALPLPGASEYRPLLTRFEVVHLPSASTVLALRADAAGRRPAPRKLAVFADPVFRADDSRVTGGPARRGVGLEASGTFPLPRLAGARREAHEILSLAPPSSRFAALDFEANLASVTSPAMAQYQIIHLATHAFVDPEHAELSSVALSLVNSEGRRREGMLRLRDIYNLRWNADLVVLSACETALGQEIRGEGLVGLARGFMYAGVPRVAASLWKIDDRQTAELMRRFYRRLLAPHPAAPAAALRAAQLETFEQSGGWEWAAFTLTGDWR